MSFKITWKTHLICFVIALVLAKSMDKIMDIMINSLFDKSLIFYPTPNLIVNFYVYMMIFMIVILVIHEWIHGITYRLFGWKVKYGFKIIYAYTHEISELPLEKTKFLIVLLAPVTIMSLATLFLPAWMGSTIYILNLLGSTGDLYMSFYLLKYTRDIRIIDRTYGFDVI